MSALPTLLPEDADAFLEPVIEFPDGCRYERIKPITDFRRDDGEARILYLCRRVSKQQNGHVDDSTGGAQYVMKVKVQVKSLLPTGIKCAIEGPSEYTKAEIQALRKFTELQTPSVPHLVTLKIDPQGSKGLFEGGYLALTMMTCMPGRNLMDLKFWSMTEEEREEIREAFLERLREIWRVGFAPYDCALRNILWDAQTKECSIVDFEHWHVAKDPINMHNNDEMQRWGIVQRPASKDWHTEWFRSEK